MKAWRLFYFPGTWSPVASKWLWKCTRWRKREGAVGQEGGRGREGAPGGPYTEESFIQVPLLPRWASPRTRWRSPAHTPWGKTRKRTRLSGSDEAKLPDRADGGRGRGRRIPNRARWVGYGEASALHGKIKTEKGLRKMWINLSFQEQKIGSVTLGYTRGVRKTSDVPHDTVVLASQVPSAPSRGPCTWVWLIKT